MLASPANSGTISASSMPWSQGVDTINAIFGDFHGYKI